MIPTMKSMMLDSQGFAASLEKEDDEDDEDDEEGSNGFIGRCSGRSSWVPSAPASRMSIEAEHYMYRGGSEACRVHVP